MDTARMENNRPISTAAPQHWGKTAAPDGGTSGEVASCLVLWWQSSVYLFSFSRQTKQHKNSEFNTCLKHSGCSTVGIEMVSVCNWNARGSSWATSRIFNFQNPTCVLLKRGREKGRERCGREEEGEMEEVVKRRPWSCGCSAATAEVKVAVESGFDPTADINIYVFLTFSSVYCGCTIFPDGLQWPLSVIQSPEKIFKKKKKGGKKQTKQTREVMSLSIEGVGGVWWRNSFWLQLVRLGTAAAAAAASRVVALFRCSATPVSHTQFLHRTADQALWGGSGKKKHTLKGEWREGTLLLVPPDGGSPHLCQLLGFVVERVHHFAHVLDGLQGCLIRLVHRRLFEYDQDSFALVQNPCSSSSV